MDEFFRTMMGRRLFESTLPSIASSLQRIADQMERSAEPNEKVLDKIADALSGKVWSPDTLDEVAELVRATGREVEDA